MKFNELLDVMVGDMKVRLLDNRWPERFEPRMFQTLTNIECEEGYESVDDIRGLRCDEMTVDAIAIEGDTLVVYANLDWML